MFKARFLPITAIPITPICAFSIPDISFKKIHLYIITIIIVIDIDKAYSLSL